MQVAEAAEVCEETVYYYLPTRQDLVFDLEEDLRERLTELIRTRTAGTSAAAAIRHEALARDRPSG